MVHQPSLWIDILVFIIILVYLFVGFVVIAVIWRYTPATREDSCEVDLLSPSCDTVVFCHTNPLNKQCVEYCHDVLAKPSFTPGEPRYDPVCEKVVCEKEENTRLCKCDFQPVDATECELLLCGDKMCLNENNIYSIKNWNADIYFVPCLKSLGVISAYLSSNMTVTPVGMPFGPEHESRSLNKPILLLTETEIDTSTFPNIRPDNNSNINDDIAFLQPEGFAYWAFKRLDDGRYILYWWQWATLVADISTSQLKTFTISDGEWQGDDIPFIFIEIEDINQNNTDIICRISTQINEDVLYLTLNGRNTYFSKYQNVSEQLWQIRSKTHIHTMDSSKMVRENYRMGPVVKWKIVGSANYFAYIRDYNFFRVTYESKFCETTLSNDTRSVMFEIIYLDPVSPYRREGEFTVYDVGLQNIAWYRFMEYSTNTQGYRPEQPRVNKTCTDFPLTIFMASINTFFVGQRWDGNQKYKYLCWTTEDEQLNYKYGTFKFDSNPLKRLIFQIE